MALNNLKKAVTAQIDETAVETINNLTQYLLSINALDGLLKQHLETFKSTLKKTKQDSTSKPKRTRVPSSYNLYIRDKMAEFKATGHTGNLMKMAIDEWNKEKSS